MPKVTTANFYQGLSDYILRGNAEGLASLFESGFDPVIAAIYRNGFHRSCREVLTSNYGSVHHWLGDDRFAVLARVYSERHPPRQGTLTGYGASFPGWLENQLDDSSSWLADMARLDWAWLDCLHGIDCTPLTAQAVQRLAEEGADIASLPIQLLTNARMVDTQNTVFPVWSAYKSGKHHPQVHPFINSFIERSSQKILLWRPVMEVYARVLTGPESAFLSELERRGDLCAASAVILEDRPEFDLSGQFAQLLNNGVLQLIGERR